MADEHVDKNERIDLINVAFSKGNNFNTKDRKSAINGMKELKRISSLKKRDFEREWNLVEYNVKEDQVEKDKNFIYSLLYPSTTSMDINIGQIFYFFIFFLFFLFFLFFFIFFIFIFIFLFFFNYLGFSFFYASKGANEQNIRVLLSGLGGNKINKIIKKIKKKNFFKLKKNIK